MTRKCVLVCIIEILVMTISLPKSRWAKVCTELEDFPATQRCTSHRKWVLLMETLHIILLALSGFINLFSHLKLVLSGGTCYLCLISNTHAELADWGCLFNAMVEHSTHSLESPTHPTPTPHVSWYTLSISTGSGGHFMGK